MSSVLKVDQIQSDTGTVNVASKIEFPVGSASAPSIFPTGDTNTGIFFPAADQLGISTNGVERVEFGNSETVFNDGGANVDFRVEGDTDANLLFVDASADNVGIGTSSPQVKLQVAGDVLNSIGASYGTNIYFDVGAATNKYVANGFGGVLTVAESGSGGFRFYTAPSNSGGAGANATITERMRIDLSGILLVGKTSSAFATSGTEIATNGVSITEGAAASLFINRQTNDGNLVEFYQASVLEGSISVSGSTVSYNQFLGSHWAALTDWSRPEIKIGTILDSINKLVIYKYVVIEVEEEIPAKEALLDDEGNEIEPAVEAHIGPVEKKICHNGNAEVGTTVSVEYKGETYQGVVELEREREFTKTVKVKVNDTAASKAVYGVFVGWNNDTNGDVGVWNDMYVGAVGNYVIRMAAGQEPEIGDLIEADGNGCGVVQDDDIVRTKTVGKITSNIVQKTYEDGSFLVTCVLYSG